MNGESQPQDLAHLWSAVRLVHGSVNQHFAYEKRPHNPAAQMCNPQSIGKQGQGATDQRPQHEPRKGFLAKN